MRAAPSSWGLIVMAGNSSFSFFWHHRFSKSKFYFRLATLFLRKPCPPLITLTDIPNKRP